MSFVGLKGLKELLQVNWGNFVMILRNRQLTAICSSNAKYNLHLLLTKEMVRNEGRDSKY